METAQIISCIFLYIFVLAIICFVGDSFIKFLTLVFGSKPSGPPNPRPTPKIRPLDPEWPRE